MGRFEGRGVLVTGGSSGIGRAAVHAFVAEGAVVAAAGRSRERLQEVRRSARDPDRVHPLVADLADRNGARRMVAEAIGVLGGIDVVVNNAGIAYEEPVLEIPDRTWDETIAVNLTAPFVVSQEAARHMIDRGGGVIVNVASTDAFAAESPQAHYNASKGALVQLTRSFAVELGHLGVRCVAVAPGMTVTPMLEDAPNEPDFRDGYLRRIPLRRFADPEEQARAILFLASDEASFVQGATLLVDGGQLAGFWYDPRSEPPVPGSAGEGGTE
jgi:NAD(P)-dependent dehydrogenase (short-subunit alcohol dehydrogenase family)